MAVRKFVKQLITNASTVYSVTLPRGIYYKLQLVLYNLQPDNNVGMMCANITEHVPFVVASGQNLEFETCIYQGADSGPQTVKLEDMAHRGIPIEKPILNFFAGMAAAEGTYMAVIYEYEPTQRI